MNKATKIIATFALGLSVFAGATAIGPKTTNAATVTASTTTQASAIANNIIATGEKYMGVPYRFGSSTGNSSTFDCSSFTQTIFKMNGISIPRSSRQQSVVGNYVSRSQLQPGDLVFFYSPIHHVALYIGNGKILHTYGAPGVTISDMTQGWWSQHYATARRLLPSDGQVAAPVNASQPAMKLGSTSATNATNAKTARIVHTVSFRSGPSLRSNRIGYLRGGETVTILDIVNAYWYKVKDQQGNIGYVSSMSRYIRI